MNMEIKVIIIQLLKILEILLIIVEKVIRINFFRLAKKLCKMMKIKIILLAMIIINIKD